MIRPLLVATLVLVALPGCDSNGEQNTFLIESELAPEGITRTTDTGEVLSTDPDDWRVAPAFRGAVEVEPAVPNPIARDGLVSITIRDTFDDAIVGGVFASGRLGNDLNQPLRLATDDSAGPVYVLFFRPSRLRLTAGDDAQLFRIRVFTEDFRLITYGDIEVR